MISGQNKFGMGSMAALWLLWGCAPGSSTLEPLVADGGPLVVIPDADGDTLSDDQENRFSFSDSDGDGTPDYLDLDSDNDTLPDSLEAGDADLRTLPRDHDADGVPSFRDLDADGNGLADVQESKADFDLDGLADAFDKDDDGDTLPDVLEIGPTPQVPRDFDGDGLPDFHDLDSDNDTLSDRDENLGDGDADGAISSIDFDSDGDGLSDRLEAGDDNLSTPPRDTDGDLRPDFVDLDSDNDGLADGREDLNGNGVVDAGESSPWLGDTDGDGVTDLVEKAAGSNPTLASDSPRTRGGFVFVVPYQENPNPTSDTLDFSTKITSADVIFAMDTTASMGGQIQNLKDTLSKNIVPALAASLPNLAMGVGEYRDFGLTPSTVSDYPWKLRHRIMTVSTAAGLQSVQHALEPMVALGGEDFPESGWEALYQIATGTGTTQGISPVSPFDPLTAPPLSIPLGESVGTLGGAGFRTGALPVAVIVTDTINHNSSLTSAYDYTFPSATFAQATSAFAALKGKMVGITARFGFQAFGDSRQELSNAVNKLNSAVSPSAWDLPGNTRPPNCKAGMCCTGIAGAEVAPEAGKCPLVFDVASDGSGLGDTVVRAIQTLTSFAPMEITTLAQDDAGDNVDAVAAFVQALKANVTAAAPCTLGLNARDSNLDGVADTFVDVRPGTRVCFDVLAKTNTTVKPTEEPQMFRATIVVQGDGVSELDKRDVYFLVPPKIEQPSIN